ncbi:uncharacterized protein EDB91DRAFT_876141 [Suillus paluster]|uniref:uncharacterized protein n=1 Tax=Suillus paluster TaxID=48578 RepID=UPI001B8705E3|nr:uncharacterized protein EDB91DRAFT_876141 [Suillus paluster]KAG1748356.1 hypothetical protein EDB91DRAFT_876141 [Suillus paluster]
MSSPLAINYPTSSSSSLYIPVHRRAPSTGSPSSSCASSPAPSSRSLSPMLHDGHPSLPIYTPSDLLLLASSPLSRFSSEELSALRAVAPEIVQTRKQRKSHEWHMRQSPSSSPSRKRSQFPSRSNPNTSESEGEGLGWRK